MSDNAYYFSHDCNAHIDERMLELRAQHGWKGYGLYWAILELMRNQADYTLKDCEALPQKLAMQFNVKAEWMQEYLKTCTDIGLFKRVDGRFLSESFLERMEEYEARKQAAKKAAKARWDKDEDGSSEETGGCDGNATAMRPQCDRNADAEQSQCDRNAIKENEIKENYNNKKHNTPARAREESKTAGASAQEELEAAGARRSYPELDGLNPTEDELIYLEKISEVEGYPFDPQKDLEYLRELREDYPQVDFVGEIKKWKSYKIDNPLKANSNPRLQIRNWFENAASGRYCNDNDRTKDEIMGVDF